MENNNMEKFKTKVGKVELESCIWNASGVKCRTVPELHYLDQCPETAVVLTKSCTYNYRNLLIIL